MLSPFPEFISYLGALLRSGDTDADALTVDKEASFALAEAIIGRTVVGHHDRPSLVSTIAIKIGAEIVEGQRKAGSDLNSVDLAIEFKTSRTPIREALMLLEKQGLIAIPPRRRPTVLIFNLDQVREVYDVRSRLLELVAAHIAERATATELLRLRICLSDMVRAKDDTRAFFWSNVGFHDQMTAVGGNLLAKTIIDSLLLRTLPLRRLSLSQPGRVAKSLDDHMRLMRAFEEHDVILAAALVRSNHASALKTVEDALSLK